MCFVQAAAAHAIARLEYGYGQTGVHQPARRSQTGVAAAHDARVGIDSLSHPPLIPAASGAHHERICAT
jgi:hypothetical protein